MLRVQRYGPSVFLIDMDLGHPGVGKCIYAHKHNTERQAIRQSDALCSEIASGLPSEKLSVSADITEQTEARLLLPETWR